MPWMGYLDNKSSNNNSSLLSNAMNSHYCLLLNRWIPPWILKESEDNIFNISGEERINFTQHMQMIDTKIESTIIKTLDAAVKFRPTPPVFKDVNNT